MNQQIIRINHVKGATLKLFAKAYVSSGALATQAAVSAIAATVKKAGETASYSGSLSKATVIFDNLQTSDPAWTDDVVDARTDRGYNFAWTVPASAFPAAGWYTIEVALTDSGGGVTKVVFEGAVRGSLS